jgi:hypothetical protein
LRHLSLSLHASFLLGNLHQGNAKEPPSVVALPSHSRERLPLYTARPITNGPYRGLVFQLVIDLTPTLLVADAACPLTYSSLTRSASVARRSGTASLALCWSLPAVLIVVGVASALG